ncbi:MAG: hypothetical protein PHS96_03650 [Anaerolineales bacterium]|nr:hypothetical protein [Anaerolineales bacterium]MDD5466879.1 hypothetical protein [Anaerolineales bacterium]
MSLRTIFYQAELSFWSVMIPLMTESPTLKGIIRGAYLLAKTTFNASWLLASLAWSVLGLVLGLSLGLLIGWIA